MFQPFFQIILCLPSQQTGRLGCCYHKIRLEYGQSTPVFDNEHVENALFLNN